GADEPHHALAAIGICAQGRLLGLALFRGLARPGLAGNRQSRPVRAGRPGLVPGACRAAKAARRLRNPRPPAQLSAALAFGKPGAGLCGSARRHELGRLPDSAAGSARLADWGNSGRWHSPGHLLLSAPARATRLVSLWAEPDPGGRAGRW